MNDTVIKNYVGVDVGKYELEVYVHPLDKRLTIKNNGEGLKKLLSFLADIDVEQIICETSGGYEYLMIYTLLKNKYKVWQAEARRIKAFIISEGRKAKTDRIDAKMIALFGAEKNCKHPKVLHENYFIELQALIKRRDELVQMCAAEKNREQQVHDDFCKKHIKKMIKVLEKASQKIEERILNIIKDNKDLSKKFDLIESIPGIGKVSAAILIGCLPELGNATDKEIAALAGVAPYAKQSGTYQGKSRIAGGRSIIRKTLYMAAMSSIQCNTAFSRFYTNLRNKKKKAKVALIAVIRKIVVLANALIFKQEFWKENHA